MANVSGGEKLTAELARIAAQLKSGVNLRVGFLSNAKYPDGTPVAMVAVWNNWGTATAPPRPFFSNMVAAKSPEWPAAIEKNLKATGFDVQKTMRLVGEGIAGQLRESIIQTNEPPNAPSTIRQKGSSKPLVWTGHMLQSVDFEIE